MAPYATRLPVGKWGQLPPNFFSKVEPEMAGEITPTSDGPETAQRSRWSPSLEGCAHRAVKGLDCWSGRVRGHCC